MISTKLNSLRDSYKRWKMTKIDEVENRMGDLDLNPGRDIFPFTLC